MANEKENHALVVDEEAPTEFTLMAKTSAESEVFDSSLCSKARKKNTDSLNSKITELTDKLFDAKNMIYHYKLGLAQVEPRLAEHINQELKYCEKIRILEFKTESKANCNENITKELVLIKKEKEGLDSKLAGFHAASKDLDSLLESQRLDKNKEGLGYSAVPPPPAQVYSPPIVGLHLKFPTGSTKFSTADMGKKENAVKASASQNNIDDKGYWNSGCSRHMTGNISYLSDYEPYDGGYVSFVQGGCKITGKGTIKTGKLEFENVYFVKDLKTPRQHNMYSIDLNNIVPHKDLTCLVVKTSADEGMLWHKRLRHLNFKTINRLLRHNLVRGLPSKCFENDHTCTACLKGKHHKASCKSKLVNSITKPLHTMHMDLFGPTSVSSISHKWYCLVVSDDFSRFTWTFFLKTKDKTSGILTKFITKIENLKDLKVKIIRCDNGGEFRNKEMNDFCLQKGIKRKFSNARTPQQNGVTERRNRTLIEAARTMLADAKLLVTFWAKVVNTACYVQNRVLVNKSHNKTPYELFNGRSPAIGFLKPFRCHVMILNTLDHLGKFKVKGDEGFFIGYCTNSTNFSGTKDAASQEPQDDCSIDVPEISGNSNPTATSTNPSADQMESLIVETPIPTISLLFEDVLGVTTNLDESNGVEADVSNMETTITASPTPTLRIHKDHPKSQIISPVDTPIQTKNKSKKTLVDYLKGVRPIRTKWVLKNKKDERGIVIKNKARLVAQRHTQEEGNDYDEVFAPVARIKAIRLFLAYASFMGFIVYQMDVKSAFLYGTIDEEVYVMQPPGFQDLEFPARVYKVEKAMYGLHQAPRAWYGTLSKYLLTNGFQRALMHEKFQMSAMGKLNFVLGLQVLQKEDGIFLSQDKYVGDILKKFGYSDVRSANTPMDKENPWVKTKLEKM
uniref:Retrovirus-related Pol polyprotein from transposon TNT 1-94 n=1 Tax=Tanacetum cinerariifolium TaxID=118510 RepID=A0A699IW42_TANCI|nr:retrovirus-related Pol polyprotein from transposon TNT 1-94 [Tanacetum cinerariifolium]